MYSAHIADDEQDEEHAEGVVGELDTAERDDSGDGKCQCAGIASGAGGGGGDRDRSEELDRDALARGRCD